MSKEKLSNKLAELHDSGDVGMAVHGLAEEADTLEQRITELEAQMKALEDSSIADRLTNETAHNTINELTAAVERLRELRKLLEQKSNEIDKNRYMNGSRSEPIDPYLATELEDQYEKIEDEFDLVLSNLLSEEAADEKNLNAVKREAYADGYYDGYAAAWGSEHDWEQHHYNYGLEQSEIEANNKYPSDKDGE